MKKIIVTLDKRTMRTTVEAKGYTGQACIEATRAIENALGKPGEREMKPEAQLPETDTDKVGLTH